MIKSDTQKARDECYFAMFDRQTNKSDSTTINFSVVWFIIQLGFLLFALACYFQP